LLLEIDDYDCKNQDCAQVQLKVLAPLDRAPIKRRDALFHSLRLG
jgi:hypothetical protein